MHPYVLIPLVAGTAAVALAASILTRDARHPGNRIVAAILGCSAYWSFLEVIWNGLDDPRWVAALIRLSSFGWMPLGALCLHLFLVSSGGGHARLRRLLPYVYAAAAVSIACYIATPWGIAEVMPTSWGWSFRHGFLFPFLFAPPSLLTTISLAVLWRRVCPPGAPPNERRQGLVILSGVAIPLTVASTTDAFLPMFDIHVPRLGSSSVALIGATVAWSIHRYGYSLLAPGTFASEILATLRDGVVLAHPDGSVRLVNESFGRLVGVPPAALLGHSIRTILPDLPADAVGMADELEVQLVRGSGERIPVSLSCSTLRDRKGDPVGRVLSVRDQRELATLRRSLMMAGRLAAVGELAAGISHEINNPLAFVKSNLSQLEKQWHDLRGQAPRETLDDSDDLIAECLEGIERVSRIVQDVRAFSHAGDDLDERADVRALLEDILRLAAPRLRHGISVVRDFSEVPPIRCNPQQLKQVFLNLTINAIQAVGGSGCIRLSTAPDGDHVAVDIEDDGPGIPPEILDRIFDPFFTTKQVGEGTGLGLSLSYEMVRRHGGEIRVCSDPGRGSRFRVRIPAASNGDQS